MAKSLKPFIIDRLYPQACKALRAEIDSSTKPPNFKENDGTNILLKLTDNFRNVQVISITGQDSGQGTRFLISDGHVTFISIITNHCATRFEAKFGQSAADLQINSFIRLEDYDLRLGFGRSEPDEYFNFLVREFSVLGNVGGPRFGDPRPIQEHVSFLNLAKLLSECREVTSSDCTSPGIQEGALTTSIPPSLLDTTLQGQNHRRPGICDGNDVVKGSNRPVLINLLDAAKVSHCYKLLGTQDTNELQRILRKATGAYGEKESASNTPEMEDMNQTGLRKSNEPSNQELKENVTTREREGRVPLTASELWADLKLTKKEFSIPHDQKKFLVEGKRHWIPRPVGRQSSMVRAIPEGALHEFTESIDELSKNTSTDALSSNEKEVPNVASRPRTPSHSIEKSNCEPEEEFVNSQEWPPSPDRSAPGYAAAAEFTKTSSLEEQSSETSSISDTDHSQRLPPDSEDETTTLERPRRRGKSKPKIVANTGSESLDDGESFRNVIIETHDENSVSKHFKTPAHHLQLQTSPNKSDLNASAPETLESAIRPTTAGRSQSIINSNDSEIDARFANSLSRKGATEHLCSPPKSTCRIIQPEAHRQHEFNKRMEEPVLANASPSPPLLKFQDSKTSDMSDPDSDVETAAPIAFAMACTSTVDRQSTPQRSGPLQTLIQVKETPFNDYPTRPEECGSEISRALIPASLEETPIETLGVTSASKTVSAVHIGLDPVQNPLKIMDQSNFKAKNLKRTSNYMDFVGLTKAKRSHVRIDPSKFALSSQTGEDPAIANKELKKAYMSDLGRKREVRGSNRSMAISRVRVKDEIFSSSDDCLDPSTAAAEAKRQFLKEKLRKFDFINSSVTKGLADDMSRETSACQERTTRETPDIPHDVRTYKKAETVCETTKSDSERLVDDVNVAGQNSPTIHNHDDLTGGLSTEYKNSDGKHDTDCPIFRNGAENQSRSGNRAAASIILALVDPELDPELLQDRDECAKDDGGFSMQTPSSCQSLSGMSHQVIQRSATKGDVESKLSDSSLLRTNPEFLKLFYSFKTAYEDYEGDPTHFNSMVNAIRSNNRIDASYWDDYIIRHRKHYKDYVNECLVRGREPLPYWKYWSKLRSSTTYPKKIATPFSISVVGQEPFQLDDEIEMLSTLCSRQEKTNGGLAVDQPAGNCPTASRKKGTEEELHRQLNSPGFKKVSRRLPWSSESKLSSDAAAHNTDVTQGVALVSQAEQYQNPPRTPINAIPDSTPTSSQNDRGSHDSSAAPPPYSAHVPRISPNGAIHKPSLKSNSLVASNPSSTSKTAKGTPSPRGWLDAKKLHKGISIFANFARKKI